MKAKWYDADQLEVLRAVGRVTGKIGGKVAAGRMSAAERAARASKAGLAGVAARRAKKEQVK